MCLDTDEIRNNVREFLNSKYTKLNIEKVRHLMITSANEDALGQNLLAININNYNEEEFKSCGFTINNSLPYGDMNFHFGGGSSFETYQTLWIFFDSLKFFDEFLPLYPKYLEDLKEIEELSEIIDKHKHLNSGYGFYDTMNEHYDEIRKQDVIIKLKEYFINKYGKLNNLIKDLTFYDLNNVVFDVSSTINTERNINLKSLKNFQVMTI